MTYTYNIKFQIGYFGGRSLFGLNVLFIGQYESDESILELN